MLLLIPSDKLKIWMSAYLAALSPQLIHCKRWPLLHSTDIQNWSTCQLQSVRLYPFNSVIVQDCETNWNAVTIKVTDRLGQEVWMSTT